MGMWQCIHNIVKSLITSGYGFSLILVVGFVGFCWVMFGGMNSADKKATLLAFLGWPVISLTGWIVAAITILAAKKLFKFQADSYERQLQALRETKDHALTLQEKLNLDSPRDQLDPKIS